MPSDVLERFLKYVTIHTTSKEDEETIPSTKRQFDLANLLVQELKELGIVDATVSDECYVIATLPSNLTPEITKIVPVVCFFAHMDTSPEEAGDNIKPQNVNNYQGGDIQLPGNLDLVISPKETPALLKFVGSDIITSDGTTLLGGDDKAGVAAIMAALTKLKADPKLKHGTIKIVFTPDEEVGRGVDGLDVDSLMADFGYTIDGDEMGVLESETFNAAGGDIQITGFNCHPGYAKGKMINAIRILADIIQNFPIDESPETTEKKKGYYHPYESSASVNEAKLKFIIRDFDFEQLKQKIRNVEEFTNHIQQKYPSSHINLTIKESYKNMKYKIDEVPEVMMNAEEAIKRTGIPVIKKAIRGGTDGAHLSYRGLPTPNIFSGAMNFHSKKEFVPVIALEKSVETIINLVQIYVERASE
ncbi:peptidase T [Candidatus Heimdallarchaeota archaeon B3_Heim]|nr:MAG: peptidase T [Candidatus Heimdallarchaeota archaeon B3_Heim]